MSAQNDLGHGHTDTDQTMVDQRAVRGPWGTGTFSFDRSVLHKSQMSNIYSRVIYKKWQNIPRKFNMENPKESQRPFLVIAWTPRVYHEERIATHSNASKRCPLVLWVNTFHVCPQAQHALCFNLFSKLSWSLPMALNGFCVKTLEDWRPYGRRSASINCIVNPSKSLKIE